MEPETQAYDADGEALSQWQVPPLPPPRLAQVRHPSPPRIDNAELLEEPATQMYEAATQMYEAQVAPTLAYEEPCYGAPPGISGGQPAAADADLAETQVDWGAGSAAAPRAAEPTEAEPVAVPPTLGYDTCPYEADAPADPPDIVPPTLCYDPCPPCEADTLAAEKVQPTSREAMAPPAIPARRSPSPARPARPSVANAAAASCTELVRPPSSSSSACTAELLAALSSRAAPASAVSEQARPLLRRAAFAGSQQAGPEGIARDQDQSAACSASRREGAAVAQAVAPEPAEVPPLKRRRLRSKQPRPEAFKGLERCQPAPAARAAGRGQSGGRSSDRHPSGATAAASTAGRQVTVTGDGWGGGQGLYVATIIEADEHTFTVTRKVGAKRHEETCVLKKYCAVLPPSAKRTKLARV